MWTSSTLINFVTIFISYLYKLIDCLVTDRINYCAYVLYVAIFNEEHDIATYTIKAVDDPRTLNKRLYINPPKNIYSHNEIVSLWEEKIGKTLERIYHSEEQVLKQIQGTFVCMYNLKILASY